MARTLYLVAYDVCLPRRLAKVTRYFHSYRVAGQKSVPEIWVTPAERATIEADLRRMLKADEDRLQLIALDPRMQPRCMGQAESFRATHFCVT